MFDKYILEYCIYLECTIVATVATSWNALGVTGVISLD